MDCPEIFNFRAFPGNQSLIYIAARRRRPINRAVYPPIKSVYRRIWKPSLSSGYSADKNENHSPSRGWETVQVTLHSTKQPVRFIAWNGTEERAVLCMQNRLPIAYAPSLICYSTFNENTANSANFRHRLAIDDRLYLDKVLVQCRAYTSFPQHANITTVLFSSFVQTQTYHSEP